MMLIFTLISLFCSIAHAQDINQLSPLSQGKIFDESFNYKSPLSSIENFTDSSSYTNKNLIYFKLKQIKISDNTIITDNEFTKIYEKYIDQEVSIDELDNIAREMTAFYRSKGFILSKVILPPQVIKDGIIEYKAVEGYIDDIIIEELPKSQARLIRQIVSKIQNSKPLNISTMERYILLANELPGLQVKTIIYPSKDKYAASDLIIIPEYHKLNYIINYDNRIKRELGPATYYSGILLNDLQSSSQAGIILQKSTKPDRLMSINYSYKKYIGHEGLKLQFLMSHVKIIPTFSGIYENFNLLDINNKGMQLSLQLSYPLVKRRWHNSDIYIKFSGYRNQMITFFGDNSIDNLRILNLGYQVNWQDKYFANNRFQMELTQGLNIFGVNDNQINRSRENASSKFTKVNVNLARAQYLPRTNVSINFAATAQYSPNKLLASEEFAIGGTEYGRAFDSGKIPGDRGIATSIELRYSDVNRYLHYNQVYGFYDRAKSWSKHQVNGIRQANAASLGFGYRIEYSKNFECSIEFAKPVTNIGRNDNRHPRIFFNVKLKG